MTFYFQLIVINLHAVIYKQCCTSQFTKYDSRHKMCTVFAKKIMA